MADVEAVDLDRRILIFDGPEGELQQLALDLIGREFEVHYANDIDEAQMLVRETNGRINAVLFTVSDALPPVGELAERFAVAPAALIPTGARPADPVVAALYTHDVRWHLWDDPPDESIRFVIASVLFEQDPLEIRFHRRIPTRLAARLEINGQKSDTTIRDISLGGACLLGGIVGTRDEEGSLCFTVGENEFNLPIRLAWAVGEADDNSSVAGVTFLEVNPASGEAINGLLEVVMARHRIGKPN